MAMLPDTTALIHHRNVPKQKTSKTDGAGGITTWLWCWSNTGHLMCRIASSSGERKGLLVFCCTKLGHKMKSHNSQRLQSRWTRHLERHSQLQFNHTSSWTTATMKSTRYFQHCSDLELGKIIFVVEIFNLQNLCRNTHPIWSRCFPLFCRDSERLPETSSLWFKHSFGTLWNT